MSLRLLKAFDQLGQRRQDQLVAHGLGLLREQFQTRRDDILFAMNQRVNQGKPNQEYEQNISDFFVRQRGLQGRLGQVSFQLLLCSLINIDNIGCSVDIRNIRQHIEGEKGRNPERRKPNHRPMFGEKNGRKLSKGD